MLPENEVRNHQSLYYPLLYCLLVCARFSVCFSLLAPCVVTLDLYIAIDSTGTLGENGHQTMRTWAKNIVDLFNIGTTPSSGTTRVEVIQFWGRKSSVRNPDSQATVDIPLSGYDDKSDLEDKIEKLKYQGGRSTIIPHGLALLRSELSKNDPSRSRNTYVLVLTDGVDDSSPKDPNPPAGTLQQEAGKLKAMNNVKVLAIGFQGTNFGEKMNVGNLETIASSKDDIISDENLGVALNKAYNKLIKQICPDSMIPTTLGEFCRK